MNIKEKRGMTVQSMLIGIIIAILSAAIIFIFLRAFPFTSTVDKEACHNSVILRNNALLGGKGILPETIPLNCKTQEIKISTSNENVIKRDIANSMYDCWWMMGEGKMDFFSESAWRDIGIPGWGTAKTSCVICSTITFEENAQGRQVDLISYIEQTKVPAKNLTYLEYFTGQEGTKLPAELKVDKLDTNKNYAIVFMGIKGADAKRAIGNYLGISGGSAFTTAALFRFGFGAAAKTALKAAGWVGLVIAVAEAAGQLSTFITSGHAAAVHCDGEREGCFALILTELTAQDIAAQCQNIESIP